MQAKTKSQPGKSCSRRTRKNITGVSAAAPSSRARKRGAGGQREEWKPAYGGFPYEVSDLGRIRRTGSTKCLKPWVNEDGYLRVGMYVEGKKRSFYVHRAVALVWCEGRSVVCNEVLHLNNDRTDCRKTNLKWGTREENLAHRWKRSFPASIDGLDLFTPAYEEEGAPF